MNLFLRCYNLTLDQYDHIILSRRLAGAVGFTVSVAVLVVILLVARRRAWDTLPKRLFFATILYTAAYCMIAAIAVNHSSPSTQKSTRCEAMGFILQYSVSLVIVSYVVLTIAVVMPVCPALQTRVERTCRSRIKELWEVVLFLGCFLFPVLFIWEPFIKHFASYGVYGPVCWFRLRIYENCTHEDNVPLSIDRYLLWTLPFAVMSFLLWVLASVITIMLCCMYCKFRNTMMGNRIKKAICHVVFLTVTVALIVCLAWLSRSQLFFENQNNTFSSLIEAVTVTPITVAGTLLLMTLYIHLPAQRLYNCCKRQCNRPQSCVTDHETPTAPSSQWDHRNVPSVTVTYVQHETVTGSDTSRLINEELDLSD